MKKHKNSTVLLLSLVTMLATVHSAFAAPTQKNQKKSHTAANPHKIKLPHTTAVLAGTATKNDLIGAVTELGIAIENQDTIYHKDRLSTKTAGRIATFFVTRANDFTPQELVDILQPLLTELAKDPKIYNHKTIAYQLYTPLNGLVAQLNTALAAGNIAQDAAIEVEVTQNEEPSTIANNTNNNAIVDNSAMAVANANDQHEELAGTTSNNSIENTEHVTASNRPTAAANSWAQTALVTTVAITVGAYAFSVALPYIEAEYLPYLDDNYPEMYVDYVNLRQYLQRLATGN